MRSIPLLTDIVRMIKAMAAQRQTIKSKKAIPLLAVCLIALKKS